MSSGDVELAWAWFWIQLEKTLSAAAMVGSSRRAGVAVFDLDRREDLPKDPDSAAALRERLLLA